MTKHTKTVQTVKTASAPNEQQFTIIPCIRPDTMQQLLKIMREEQIESFDRMLHRLLQNWDDGANARHEVNSPRGQIDDYLAEPERLNDPTELETFEALKRLHPKDYRDAIVIKHIFADRDVARKPGAVSAIVDMANEWVREELKLKLPELDLPRT